MSQAWAIITVLRFILRRSIVSDRYRINLSKPLKKVYRWLQDRTMSEFWSGMYCIPANVLLIKLMCDLWSLDMHQYILHWHCELYCQTHRPCPTMAHLPLYSKEHEKPNVPWKISQLRKTSPGHVTLWGLFLMYFVVTSLHMELAQSPWTLLPFRHLTLIWVTHRLQVISLQ